MLGPQIGGDADSALRGPAARPTVPGAGQGVFTVIVTECLMSLTIPEAAVTVTCPLTSPQMATLKCLGIPVPTLSGSLIFCAGPAVSRKAAIGPLDSMVTT